jgi:hypothetical protein
MSEYGLLALMLLLPACDMSHDSSDDEKSETTRSSRRHAPVFMNPHLMRPVRTQSAPPPCTAARCPKPATCTRVCKPVCRTSCASRGIACHR